MTDIIVTIQARVTDGDGIEYEEIAHVPPGYTATDTANLLSITVENVGWHALRDAGLDAPLRDAFVGNDAKLARLEQLVAILERDWSEVLPDSFLAQLRELSLVDPKEAFARWGGVPGDYEGEDD